MSAQHPNQYRILPRLGCSWGRHSRQRRQVLRSNHLHAVGKLRLHRHGNIYVVVHAVTKEEERALSVCCHRLFDPSSDARRILVDWQAAVAESLLPRIPQARWRYQHSGAIRQPFVDEQCWVSFLQCRCLAKPGHSLVGQVTVPLVHRQCQLHPNPARDRWHEACQLQCLAMGFGTWQQMLTNLSTD